MGINHTNSMSNHANTKLYVTKSGSSVFNNKKNENLPTNNLNTNNTSTNNYSYNNLKKKNVSICSTFRPESCLQNTVSFGNGAKTHTNSNKVDNIGFCNIRISGHKNESNLNNFNMLTSSNTDLL